MHVRLAGILTLVATVLGSAFVYPADPSQHSAPVTSGQRCTRLTRSADQPSAPIRVPGGTAAMPGNRCTRLSSGPPGLLPNTAPAVTLADFTRVVPINAEAKIRIRAIASDPDRDTMLYTWSVTGGRISAEGTEATWDLTSAPPGRHSVTIEVDDGCGCLTWATRDVFAAGNMASMPTARWAPGLGAIDGVIYVAGGYNPTLGGHLTTFEAYDVATNTFSSRAARPGIQTGATAGVINGVLYVAGGSDCCVNTPRLTAYTVASNTWTTRKAPSSAHGNGPAGGVIGGLFYVAGGSNLDGSGSVSVLEAYDPRTDVWALKAPLPTARRAVGSAVLGGKLYVVGGVSSTLGTVGTVEAYDPATNTWTTRAPLPAPRSELVVGAIDGILYAAGGTTPAGPVSIVEAYDPATNTWSPRDSLPVARRGAQGTVVRGKLYVVGGYTTGGHTALSIVESFDPREKR